MAIYHCSAKIIGRSSGRSSVAAAAYRSGQKLYNEYDGLIHDYTRKGGVVHSEVLLCKNAPREWANRAALWNSVERAEKSIRAQLAREYELALPAELVRQEQIELLREYIQKNFVDKGMCADMAIHDKGDGNPHAHVMLTMRPVLTDGRWGEKQRKEYMLDRNGQRQYDPVKQTYRCQTIKSTDWDSREFLEQARAAWASAVNKKIVQLKVPEIDHRSYKDQGKDQLPTVHLGTTAHRMEQKGIRTELGDINRRIHTRNRRVLEIERQLKGLAEERKGLGRIIDVEKSEKAQQSPGYAHWAKLHNLKVSADAMNFLPTKGISNYEQLLEVETKARQRMQGIKKEINTIKDKLACNGRLMRDKIQYNDTKAIYMAYAHGGKKQAFRKDHSAEIEQYEAAVDRLREAEKQMGHKPPPMKELKSERAQLTDKLDTLESAHQVARSESKELTAARLAVEKQLGIGRDIPQPEKLSINERLEAYKTREQKKPSYTPANGKLNIHGLLEHYKTEAEKQNAELIEKQRHNRKPGFDRDGPSR